MQNKKVLLIGTSFSAIPLLASLKNLGYHVSVCGGLKDDPCHNYADKSFYIDYSKKELLLDLCQREDFDFIVPSCNDYAYNSASYVAEKLQKFYGFDEHKTTMLLHTKNSFRDYTQKNNFEVPKALDATEITKESIKELRMPLLVKPDESFSGKGVSKVEDLRQLDSAIKIAQESSRNSKVVVEEFVEGTLHSHSAFIQNGKILTDFFVDEFCSVYPYQVDSSSISTNLSKEIKTAIYNSISKLVSSLKLCDGLLHTQFIASKKSFWLIETMRRCPGDLYGELIKKSTGFNYATFYVKPFLNEKNITPEHTKDAFVARHTVSVDTPLLYSSFSHTIPSSNIDIYPLKNSGDLMKEAPFDKSAILFAEFKNTNELKKHTPFMANFINIHTIKGLYNDL